MPSARPRIAFDAGTLTLARISREDLTRVFGPIPWVWDLRAGVWRCDAIHYARAVELARQAGLAVEDEVPNWQTVAWGPLRIHALRPEQQKASAAWRLARRGLIVMPTGTGKTEVALAAMAEASLATLVVAPVRDLMYQWHRRILAGLGYDAGIIGDSLFRVRPVSVTTYDSACIHMERLGNQFGLIVFDECHHLPGPTYGLSATSAIAPFRLGLTATPERADNAHTHLDQLIGPIVFRREITELRGQFLAEYRVLKLYVALSEEERTRYERARELYRGFVQQSGINMSQPDGWSKFLYLAFRSPEGREAFHAYREQRTLALAAPAKLNLLARLLDRHNGDRVIIFTHDNATVYTIARQFLVPVITHQTKTKERRDVLVRFNSGAYPIVATSKVLNEGVNIPEANVAIILSGSGSVREHVQRLGRILRKSGDKEAILYEVITRGTVEEFTSNRRRQHSAYDGN